jgi:hypothetical protein
MHAAILAKRGRWFRYGKAPEKNGCEVDSLVTHRQPDIAVLFPHD